MDYTKQPIPKQKALFYGADYNPDQWLHSPETIEQDIVLMKKAGVTSVSLGIFSWATLEPAEGVYDFGWLDQVMDRFAAERMYVFLATPSGGKPMWMSEKYPEIRRVGKDGVRECSGARHNHCLSSSVYREKARAMNAKLAARYKGHPALALWHVGNEFSGECHCDLCRAEFQKWLKRRYGTLEALNGAWWTNFWGHVFTSWSEIPTHDESIDGLLLDWDRFVNDQHVSFMLNEMEPLREHTREVPCTTNFMGTFRGNNYWQWAEHLDVISNDLYPLPDDRDDTWRQAIRADFIHALMRGMSGGKPWMLLECSPSSVNWGSVNKLKRPDVHRQEVLQAVANGADTIHYFQWRKGRGGFEKYHGAVVDHVGSDQTRVFKECAQIGSELKELSALLGQDCPQADVAILYDWESRWALNHSAGPKVIKGDGPFGSDMTTETAFDHFEALTTLGVAADIVSTRSDFSQYRVLVLPVVYLMTAELSQRIQEFVTNGGTLIGTYLTAYVNVSNLCWQGGFPGAGLRSVFGIWNEELDNLHDETEVIVASSKNNSLSGKARDVVERTHLETAKSLAYATTEFYAGHSLISENIYGAGRAYYLSARLDGELIKKFYSKALEKAQISSRLQIKLPEGVVYRQRKVEGGILGFLFNYTKYPTVVDLEGHTFEFWDPATETFQGKLEIAPYASVIVRKIEGPDVSFVSASMPGSPELSPT